jgi:iron-sulfur cluster assembly protein
MVTVTDSALGHLKALITKSDGEADAAVGLRVFVQPGGCSGFSYGMGLDENPPREDDEVDTVDGVAVYVDSFSARHLDGAEIDYVDALMGGGFTINNPQATKTCGCGHSFQTADQAGQAKSCSA